MYNRQRIAVISILLIIDLYIVMQFSIIFFQVRPINFEDFKSALLQVRASVSSKDLQLYKEWNQTYGSFGW